MRRSGRLTADEVEIVRTFATDPELAAEDGLTPARLACDDGYTYVVTVGSVRIGFVDCSNAPHMAGAVIRYLQTFTDSLPNAAGPSPSTTS